MVHRFTCRCCHPSVFPLLCKHIKIKIAFYCHVTSHTNLLSAFDPSSLAHAHAHAHAQGHTWWDRCHLERRAANHSARGAWGYGALHHCLPSSCQSTNQHAQLRRHTDCQCKCSQPLCFLIYKLRLKLPTQLPEQSISFGCGLFKRTSVSVTTANPAAFVPSGFFLLEPSTNIVISAFTWGASVKPGLGKTLRGISAMQ